MLAFTDQRFPPLTVTHLSDGCAELTLKDLLQRLKLVTGDITRLLQLLQELNSPGNIWQKEGERMCVSVCVWVLMPRGQREKNAPFNYINSTATRKALERIDGWDNGNRLSQGQLGQER